MEALILERLEEGVDALFVEAMDEFQKVRDEIHLDKEKAEQLEIKEFDCEEAIRELKELHYSGRWGENNTEWSSITGKSTNTAGLSNNCSCRIHRDHSKTARFGATQRSKPNGLRL